MTLDPAVPDVSVQQRLAERAAEMQAALREIDTSAREYSPRLIRASEVHAQCGQLPLASRTHCEILPAA